MAVHHSGKCKSDSEGACDDGIDLAAIDNALALIASKTAEKKPKGFTVEEYAAKRDITRRSAQEHLLHMYRSGAVDRTIWKNPVGQKTYVYRLTNGTKR